MHNFDFLEGEVLLIDKPLDWTSFDVVGKVRNQIRKIAKRKLKVGHAGTLDPKATGLLILCTGKKTKTIDSIQGQEKEYTGSFELGATTPTYDTESEIDKRFPLQHLNLEMLQAHTKDFLGNILQKPPMHSAIRKDGKRLYELARKGQEIEVEAREVHISSFEIESFEAPIATFKVVCSKGTYIRSLAYDFGKAVNSGGFLKTLRRTRIGDYKVEDAMGVDTFVSLIAQMEIKAPDA